VRKSFEKNNTLTNSYGGKARCYMCSRQSALKGSVVTIVKYTHDEPCGILCALKARNMRDGEREYTLFYPVRRYQDANEF
jgi:hypothetical protein